jgi:hypothetical protein
MTDDRLGSADRSTTGRGHADSRRGGGARLAQLRRGAPGDDRFDGIEDQGRRRTSHSFAVERRATTASTASGSTRKRCLTKCCSLDRLCGGCGASCGDAACACASATDDLARHERTGGEIRRRLRPPCAGPRPAHPQLDRTLDLLLVSCLQGSASWRGRRPEGGSASGRVVDCQRWSTEVASLCYFGCCCCHRAAHLLRGRRAGGQQSVTAAALCCSCSVVAARRGHPRGDARARVGQQAVAPSTSPSWRCASCPRAAVRSPEARLGPRRGTNELARVGLEHIAVLACRSEPPALRARRPDFSTAAAYLLEMS